MERIKKAKDNQGVLFSLNSVLSQYHSIFWFSFQYIGQVWVKYSQSSVVFVLS